MEFLIAGIIVLIFLAYSLFAAVDNVLKRVIEETLKEFRIKYGEERYWSTIELKNYLVDAPDTIRSWKIFRKPIIWFLASRKNLSRRCRSSTIIEESYSGSQLFRLKIRDSSLLDSFDWEDSKIYEWKIERPKVSLWMAILICLMAWAAFLFTFFCIFWLIDLIFPIVALILAVLLYFMMAKAQYDIWTINSVKLDSMEDNNALIHMARGESIFKLLPSGIMTGMLLFALASEYLPIDQMFSGPVEEKINWILYAIDRTANELFYDIVDVSGQSIHGLKPISIYGRLVATLIKFHLIFSGINMIILVYKLFRGKVEIFSGTIKQCYARVDVSINDFGEDKILCLGELSEFEEPIVITGSKMKESFRENFEEDSVKINPFV